MCKERCKILTIRLGTDKGATDRAFLTEKMINNFLHSEAEKCISIGVTKDEELSSWIVTILYIPN